jgi:hypothetical protein
MPSELEEMYEKKFKRTKSVNKIINTASRVFTEYILEDNIPKDSRMDVQKNYKRFVRATRTPSYAQDNISELISYRDGPKFRKEVLLYKNIYIYLVSYLSSFLT